MRGRDFLVIGQIFQAHVLRAESDQNFVQLDVVIHVFLALLALDLVERRLGDVDLAGANQFGHLPEEEGQEQGADVGSVHVGIGHDNDAAVAQLGDIEAAFLLAVAILLRLADAGADGRDHRLDFVILKKLVFARFLDVDQFAADGEDGLVTPIAPLFGRAAGGIALDNVKFGQFRVALGTVGQFAG